MMHGRYSTRYYKGPNYEYVALPLAYSMWEMGIVLPLERGNLRSIFVQPSSLLGLENRATKRYVDVYLPQFQRAEWHTYLMDDFQTLLEKTSAN